VCPIPAIAAWVAGRRSSACQPRLGENGQPSTDVEHEDLSTAAPVDCDWPPARPQRSPCRFSTQRASLTVGRSDELALARQVQVVARTE